MAEQQAIPVSHRRFEDMDLFRSHPVALAKGTMTELFGASLTYARL